MFRRPVVVPTDQAKTIVRGKHLGDAVDSAGTDQYVGIDINQQFALCMIKAQVHTADMAVSRFGQDQFVDPAAVIQGAQIGTQQDGFIMNHHDQLVLTAFPGQDGVQADPGAQRIATVGGNDN